MPELSFEAQQALIQWIAFLLCVAAGYLLSRRAYLPETPLIWIGLAIAVFAFGFIPILRTPIVILRAPIPLGTLLWGVGIGAVLGLMINQAQKRGSRERTGDGAARRHSEPPHDSPPAPASRNEPPSQP